MRKLNLLLIEDNKGDARLLQELLKECWDLDLTFVLKETLAAGLLYMKENTVDLVLLDLSLPDSTGIDTVKRILSQFVDVPVIVMTGLKDDLLAIKAVRIGVQDYLVKGEFDSRLLVRSIQYSIERHKLTKERYQVERALLESQKQSLMLAELLERSSQPFAVGFPDGRLGLCNVAFCKLTGYTKNEIKTLDWLKITPPEWIVKEREFLDELVRTGNPVQYEKEYIRKDGTRVPIELLAHLIRDEASHPLYFYAFVTDISARKRAEEEIRFKSVLLDSAIDSVFVHDMPGNIFYVNETAYKTRGYTKEELMSLNLHRLDLPEYARLIEHHIEELKSTNGATFESAHFRKDGAIIPVEVHANLIRMQGDDLIFSIYRDITERKKNDEVLSNTLSELKKERDKAQQYLDIAGTILVALDRDGNITLLNKTGCEILGVKQEEALGLNWFDNFLTNAEKDAIKEFHHGYMTGLFQGEFKPHDNPIRPRTGAERMISWHNVILRDHNGRIVGTLSSGEDITSRKEYESKLKAQKSTLEGIMESSESPIFSVDVNYCYTSFNKSHVAAMKALYSVNIEIGKKIIDYQTVLEDRVEAKKNIDRALRGERVVAEAYSGEDSLTRSYFVVSHNPIWDFEGKVVGVAVSAHDITIEKIAQAKIESMARFPIENPTPVLRVSKAGLILFSNKAGAKFLTSLGFSNQDPVPEFLRGEISSCWEAMIPRVMEIQALNRVFSFFLVPIPEFGYVNLYGTDITDLKNAQQSLSKLNAELEARVEERTKSLKEAQERMMRQEKLASIGKLAGSIGHELRNPLCVISNSVYYLGSKLPPGDEKIKRHMAIIREESDRANNIISQLLDFARTKPEDITEVDITVIINEIINENSTPHNINISLSQGTILPRIHADPNKIRQVFQNIITNAFQAMLDGGTLEIKTLQNENEIEIAFKDTGVGISIENLSKIFEPLFSTKVKGIGLGLPIAKEIVESVGGKIVVESKVGVGSTFIVKLPVKPNNCFIDS